MLNKEHQWNTQVLSVSLSLSASSSFLYPFLLLRLVHSTQEKRKEKNPEKVKELKGNKLKRKKKKKNSKLKTQNSKLKNRSTLLQTRSWSLKGLVYFLCFASSTFSFLFFPSEWKGSSKERLWTNRIAWRKEHERRNLPRTWAKQRNHNKPEGTLRFRRRKQKRPTSKQETQGRKTKNQKERKKDGK